jgi:hypothetical protein
MIPFAVRSVYGMFFHFCLDDGEIFHSLAPHRFRRKRIHMLSQTSPQIAHARQIVSDPARHTPRVRYLAWMLLKTAQGTPVRQSNLPPVPDRDTPMTETLRQMAEAREKRRALLSLPTGGDAA